MAYDDRDDDDFNDLDIRRRGGTVPNYLTQAILVTLFCCTPLGIVAIVNASKVNSHLAKGEYEQAVQASEEAKRWCWISLFAGLVAAPVMFFLQIQAGR